MLIATVIHWDRFNHGDADAIAAIAFYAWTSVYVVSPFAVFAIWWRNRATLTWLYLGGLLGTAGALAQLQHRTEAQMSVRPTSAPLRNTVRPIDPGGS
jgi:hypothetical protein